MTKGQAGKIIALLKKEYPKADCTLDFRSPHQLLVSTILSAQCTDERVNIVTKELFKKYKKPSDYADANIKALENDIRSTGFFRNKAKSIKESAAMIANNHSGKIPDTLAELVKLPGVGRKTASVILGTAFRKAEGIVVDTHVARLSQRLGFTNNKDAVRIEKDLMAIIPKKDWIIFSHLMISHGRAVCKARKPACGSCALAKQCPSAGKF
ncbi:MAG: endonuclease III [Deltaproteobacteria bacterium]|nr:endonuclease III [Deltaproteobacteria bacterium]